LTPSKATPSAVKAALTSAVRDSAASLCTGLLGADLVGRAQLVVSQGIDLGDEVFVFGWSLPIPRMGLPASRTNSWMALMAMLPCS
jgi:hypothetical protein